MFDMIVEMRHMNAKLSCELESNLAKMQRDQQTQELLSTVSSQNTQLSNAIKEIGSLRCTIAELKGTHTLYFSSSLYIINQKPMIPRTHFHCIATWVAMLFWVKFGHAFAHFVVSIY